MSKIAKSIGLLGASIVFVGLAAQSAAALPCDRLGSRWDGCEYNQCQWKFEFRRTSCGSNVWNAYWRHFKYPRVQGNITISISGRTVTILRPSIGGAPSCTYTGTWRPRDVHNALPYRVSGTYTCGSYTGPWRANIR